MEAQITRRLDIKQSKLAFGLQTPESTVATPGPSSSRSRKKSVSPHDIFTYPLSSDVKIIQVLETDDTPRAQTGEAERNLDTGLPTPQATARRLENVDGTARNFSDDTSPRSPSTRPASPISISSSSLDHIPPPPASRVNRNIRPLRQSGSIIEFTSSEEDNTAINPFQNSATAPTPRSSTFLLPQLSGPLSPLTQHSSMESNDEQAEFKVPELPTRVRDAPISHPYSHVVPSSQSQEVFGPSPSRRRSKPSPTVTT